MARQYNLDGSVSLQTYPSERSVSYAYDTAGRTNSFSGNLGDGVQKTYASEIIYSPFGSMTKEKFGTDTAIYNKLFYNSRGQLAEIREGTTYTGPNDSSWNRGAIINHYSNGCWGACGGSNSTTAMTDNNGNLKKQEVYIPNNEQLPTTSYTQWWQGYDYDGLNRLQRVHEYTGNTQTEWQQEYVYDAFGNRRIEQDGSRTYGIGINKKDFSVNTANNRLGVPSGQTGTMSYDNAGNLTTDTYSGNGVTRVYDAENRMKSETQASSYLAGSYTYDGDGRRVRRTVGSSPSAIETWQIYGFDGELVAEYAANVGVTSPQKEYGYRNGQLLIAAEAPTSSAARTNYALAANGGTASASSSLSTSFPAFSVNNGDRKGLNWGSGGGWRDAEPGNTFPDWVEVDFNGSKTIDEVDVFTVQDNYASPSTPTETMTFSLYGLSGYEVQYWDGSAWATVSGGNVSGNNKVWKRLTFTPVTTTKVRVLTNASADNYSRLVEVEAWGDETRSNVAAAANGGTATASSELSSSFPAVSVNNGDRKGLNWGSGGGWRDAEPGNTFPDWVQVDFSSSQTIDEVDVFTVQDSYASPFEPTETMTFSTYGLTSFDVQYWNGSAWVTVTGGSISGNNKVWRKINFSPVTTSKIRVLTNAAVDGYSRLTEIEAWTAVSGGSSTVNINWLVTDQLGTPRIIFDKSGSLATTQRRDYAPFGEELFNGLRTTAMGYGAADSTRQKFTSKERDNETGLDYFGARYYASMQGRFTGADPYDINLERQNTADPDEADALFRDYIFQPQHWNRYAYALNNPLRYVDPDGRLEYETELLGKKIKVKISDKIDKKDQAAIKESIDNAIAKINAGADKLTSEQTKAINQMRGLEVGDNKSRTGMHPMTRVYMMTQHRVENSTLDELVGDIIHDSHHADQFERGLKYNEKTAIEREKEASAFALGVFEKIGVTEERVIRTYKHDVEHGHTPYKNKSRPPKIKSP